MAVTVAEAARRRALALQRPFDFADLWGNSQ